MDLSYSEVKVKDIATIERARAGVIYKAGSTLVRLAATNENVEYLTEDGEVETRFAVIAPRKEKDAQYIYYMIQDAFPEFLRRHRTTINLQYSELSHLTIKMHGNAETRRAVVEMMELAEAYEKHEERLVEMYKDEKRYCLEKMFV